MTRNEHFSTSKLIDVHWGWITPGVGQSNRKRQLDLYLDILEARRTRGERFYFTQPGWLLDIEQSDAVRRITAETPEKGKADGPMRPEQLARFRAAVQRGQLVYVAYPYSGAVVEGMTGEAVLKSLRLSKQIAERHLGGEVKDFFVHDGPFQLDWNAPMIPQIGLLSGFTRLFGRTLARIAATDGSVLEMLGLPAEGSELLYTGTEAPHLPNHIEELTVRFGNLVTASAADVDALFADRPLPIASAEAIRTKGWYGGAPLVMRQQAALRRTDIALSILSFNHALRNENGQLLDFWKRSLVLQDCHLQWLLADVATHYLPLAEHLEKDVREMFTAVTDTSTSHDQAPNHVLNLLPHRRSGVIHIGEKYLACREMPAASSSSLTEVEATVRATTVSLENNRIRVELGPAGEILSVHERNGKTLYAGVANQVRHWVNRPAAGNFLLRQMSVWDQDFCGCLRMECDVEVVEEGEYEFFCDVVRGLAVAMSANDGDWIPITNLHWGGGLPSGNQEHGYSQHARLKLKQGHNRIILHTVADEGFKLRDAVLRKNGNHLLLQYWQCHKVLEWAPDPFVIERVAVKEMGARAAVEFHGRFATCEAILTVSLDDDSEAVNVHLVQNYREPVFEGIQTLPLPVEVGSYLGSYCERPYVPAFTVEHQTWRGTSSYTSDKPYGFTMAQDSGNAWHTGQFREIYAGMAPFLGVFTAIAESSAGSLAMLTDGYGHFFRRRSRNSQAETLGLSLGTSVIHPMTQNYRMPAGSYWEKIGRSSNVVDYDDAHERCDFTCPRGEMSCSWSLLFTDKNSLSRQTCHEQLLNRLFPPLPTFAPRSSGFRLQGKGVIMTGLEYEEAGIVLRLVNLEPHEQEFTLEAPWELDKVDYNHDLQIKHFQKHRRGISGTFPPLAVREIILKLK